MSAARQPALFVSHGSPTLPLEQSAATDFLRQFGPSLGRPGAILVISAHWNTARPAVSGGCRAGDDLRFLRLPAGTVPAALSRAAGLLEDAGLQPQVDPQRGLDHGAWTALMLMYAQADIPVTQLSIQSRLGPVTQ